MLVHTSLCGHIPHCYTVCITNIWKIISRKTIPSFKTELKLEEDAEGSRISYKPSITESRGESFCAIELFSSAEHSLGRGFTTVRQMHYIPYEKKNPKHFSRNTFRKRQVRKLKMEMLTVTLQTQVDVPGRQDLLILSSLKQPFTKIN